MSSCSTLQRGFCLHTQPPSIPAKTENQAIIAVALLSCPLGTEIRKEYWARTKLVLFGILSPAAASGRCAAEEHRNHFELLWTQMGSSLAAQRYCPLAFQVFSFTAPSKAVSTCTQHRPLYETAQWLLTHLLYYHTKKAEKRLEATEATETSEGAISAAEETNWSVL